MQRDDDQLDQWLREVSVPPELKARLKELPVERLAVAGPSRVMGSGWIAGLVLAASLAVVALWLYWPEAARPDREQIAKPNVQRVDGLSPDEPETDRKELEALNQQIAFLNARISLLDARSRLARTRPRDPAGEVSRVDRHSLIRAMSEQAALELGVEPQTVRNDLEKVVEAFPGSAGARLASQFLAGMNN